MMRVYAIHTGTYSDQSWGPVFSTVEKALAYTGGTADDIEVHVLDDENDTGPCYPEWRLHFNKAGDVVEHRESAAGLFEPNLHKPSVYADNKDSLWVERVKAPDLEHAVKIAADMRRQFLARRGW